MIKELVREFFSLDIIKDAKIQLHLQNPILEINVEQFLKIFDIILIENIIFRDNSITNLLKNEIKKITIEVVFNKNIKKFEVFRNITITKEIIKEKKIIKKEIGYVDVIDLNKINIIMPPLDISEIEILFNTLLMYLRVIGEIKKEEGV
jgi:hypothetical protein